jgi:tetratricopeptide (TPR) repeat protein
LLSIEANQLGNPVFSPDASRLAALVEDGIRVYDARSGQELLAVKGREIDRAPVFSPDGSRIAVLSRDSVVRLYDANTGQELLAFNKPTGTWLLGFHPDGSQLAVLDVDGKLWAWNAPKDLPEWQAQRRQVLAETLVSRHRTQADEAIKAGQWFAAAFHLNYVLATKPDDAKLHLQCGQALAAQGKTTESKLHFEKALSLDGSLTLLERATAHVELGDLDAAQQLYSHITETQDATPQDFSRYVSLSLQLGNQQAYSQACAAMLKRFGSTEDPGVANEIAWTCALGPDAISDLKTAVELARLAVHANPKQWQMRNTLGAVLYRAGQHKEAVDELNESIKLNDKGGSAFDFVVLAMAHYRLGQTEEARRWLDKAMKADEKDPVFQVLRREAETLIKGLAPKDSK